jgi:hypothetical protein
VKCTARDHGAVARNRKERKGRKVKAKERSNDALKDCYDLQVAFSNCQFEGAFNALSLTCVPLL